MYFNGQRVAQADDSVSIGWAAAGALAGGVRRWGCQLQTGGRRARGSARHGERCFRMCPTTTSAGCLSHIEVCDTDWLCHSYNGVSVTVWSLTSLYVRISSLCMMSALWVCIQHSQCSLFGLCCTLVALAWTWRINVIVLFFLSDRSSQSLNYCTIYRFYLRTSSDLLFYRPLINWEMFVEYTQLSLLLTV